MHELSIVTYVIKQVDEIAKENKLTNIQSVTLEFGEVSGIVPESATAGSGTRKRLRLSSIRSSSMR